MKKIILVLASSVLLVACEYNFNGGTYTHKSEFIDQKVGCLSLVEPVFAEKYNYFIRKEGSKFSHETINVSFGQNGGDFNYSIEGKNSDAEKIKEIAAGLEKSIATLCGGRS